MANINLEVKGMTCGHCVMSVTEELSEISGVDTVSVDLATGEDQNSNVSVTTSGEVTDDALNDAIAEAGFELVSVSR
ncbi:MAG TPA: heavy-metal-associated domain-containing protein [Actinomyces sp.]|jgi:copper chaperone|nr:cation transporter [Acidobacteriota bacterium]HHT40555.1 heavy-metal-associated domain-containing protein [Actinomyces sp.]